MKVLITGANGLLGQKLVEQLAVHPGFGVVATGRGPCRIPSGRFEYASMDVTSLRDLEVVFDEHRPNAVIHTAAMTHVDLCEKDPEGCHIANVVSVEYLIQCCSNHDARLIHLSTDFIFDGEDGPYKESATPNPLSVYGESKLASEKLLQSSDIRWAVARTVLVYGISHDMTRSNIILWVKKSLEEGKRINVVDDQWRTPTLAEDLAIGCILILEKNTEGIFNIAGRDMLTPYEIAIETASFFGLDKELIKRVDGTMFQQPARRPARTGFDLSKARKVLGYEPRTFRQGLELLARQLQEVKTA